LTALVPVLMVLFGFGTKTIIITTTLFAVWIIILNARAGVLQIKPVSGGNGPQLRRDADGRLLQIYFWAAFRRDSGGVRSA
jgi:NitT/TauT family transport system permease protein